jgi:HAD superfamily hydrolase (TIGR01459 family)
MMHSAEVLAQRYDLAIVDLWGVVHDGTALYPGARKMLQQLRSSGMHCIFLSNAPRRVEKARAVLTTLGIDETLYDGLLTSGEEAFMQLSADPTWLGTRYYYLGPGKDEDILSDAPVYQRVKLPEDADFVLNTGFEFDFQPEADVLPTLHRLLKRRLPLLCVNPDREVVKLDGTQMLCAGVVAATYEALGGVVHRIGKPYLSVYARVMEMAGNPDPARVIAFGDTPATDILGAHRAGIDSVLVTGGVLAAHYPQLSDDDARALCKEQGCTPTFITSHFASAL